MNTVISWVVYIYLFLIALIMLWFTQQDRRRLRKEKEEKCRMTAFLDALQFDEGQKDLCIEETFSCKELFGIVESYNKTIGVGDPKSNDQQMNDEQKEKLRNYIVVMVDARDLEVTLVRVLGSIVCGQANPNQNLFIEDISKFWEGVQG
jgi:hypothetical protein